ncbi:MAG: Mur ligase family protein [Candidatus Kaiserbacteria bacterium]|nr:Mur ligase family protein [Candidatus Kaiserbacteria bacterium]
MHFMQKIRAALPFRRKKAYFIGIAGAGMSATAQLLKTLGWEVSGSDEGAYPPITTYLEQHHIPYAKTHSKNNVPRDADLIVVGKHAGLTKEENEEVAYVYDNNFTIRSFPEVLQDLTKRTHNLICAGSYGKSTCAGMAAWCLMEQDPSFFIGALPYNLATNARSGKGDLFILEGDEYPAANTDPISKFFYYNAIDLLITSLEHDHLNVFPTQEAYTAPFLQLIDTLPSDGLLIVSGEDEQMQETLPTIQRPVITYGASPEYKTDWYADAIVYGVETSFDLCHTGKTITSLTTPLLGRHNIENIVGVSALLLERKLITPEVLQERIRTFTGLRRRLDKKTEKSSVLLYEGFGSSHGKALSALAAMKTHFPDKRLLVVFEPHSLSWRRKEYVDRYQGLFDGAEKVFVYLDAVPAPQDDTTVAGEAILTHITDGGADAVQLRNDLSPLLTEIKEGDLILCLSSGDLGGLLPTLTETLETQFPV